MNAKPSLPTYEEFTHSLHHIDNSLDAAETHGLLCGYLCATSGAEKMDTVFKNLLLDGKKNQKVYTVLQQSYEASYDYLTEFSFEFNLILPDDDTDINVRAEALGLWCQGFLTGLAQSTQALQNHPDPEITEALNDLKEITQVKFGDISNNDEDETAYFELVEYVRLTALMLFNELKSDNSSGEATKNTQLH